MAKSGLTKETVGKLPAKAARYEVSDGGAPGLVLRVSPDGSKTWAYRYRFNGAPHRYTIGAWPTWLPDMARRKAMELQVQVDNGEDPARARDAGVTMADLAKRFVDEHCPSLAASTVRTYRVLLDRHILPAVGKIPVQVFALGDAGKLHHAMRGMPRTANQSLAVVSRMLSLAELWGLRDPQSNPCGVIQRFPETKRDRYLTINAGPIKPILREAGIGRRSSRAKPSRLDSDGFNGFRHELGSNTNSGLG